MRIRHRVQTYMLQEPSCMMFGFCNLSSLMVNMRTFSTNHFRQPLARCIISLCFIFTISAASVNSSDETRRSIRGGCVKHSPNIWFSEDGLTRSLLPRWNKEGDEDCFKAAGRVVKKLDQQSQDWDIDLVFYDRGYPPPKPGTYPKSFRLIKVPVGYSQGAVS